MSKNPNIPNLGPSNVDTIDSGIPLTANEISALNAAWRRVDLYCNNKIGQRTQGLIAAFSNEAIRDRLMQHLDQEMKKLKPPKDSLVIQTVGLNTPVRCYGLAVAARMGADGSVLCDAANRFLLQQGALMRGYDVYDLDQ